MLFPTHLQAREVCPQTYSLSLPLEWSQVTHFPASIRLSRAYKPEKSAFNSTFARQLCDDTHLPFQQTHKHSSPVRQVLHTQTANNHIQRARKSFNVFLSFKVPPSYMKAQATSKGHDPLVDSGCRNRKV